MVSGLVSGAPSRARALMGREEQPRALMECPLSSGACGSQGGGNAAGGHQQPSRQQLPSSRQGRPGLSRCMGEVGWLPGTAFCPPVSMPPRSRSEARRSAAPTASPLGRPHTSSKRLLCAGRGPPRQTAASRACARPRMAQAALLSRPGRGVGAGIFEVVWGHTSGGRPWVGWPEDSGGSGW